MDVTIEQFEEYKCSVKKYLDFFGIHNWELVFFFEDLSDGNEVASLTWDMQARHAIFKITKVVPDAEAFHFNIDKIAFHEVCELLLVRLHDLALNRSIILSDIIEAKHEIIHYLEYAFYKEIPN